MSTHFQTDAHWAAAVVRTRLDARAAFLASNPAIDTPEAERAFIGSIVCPPAPKTGMRATLLTRFGLDASETALLDLAIATRFDPSLESRIAEIQGKPWRPQPTEALARRLFDLPDGEIARPTSPLMRWHMVHAILDPSGAAPSYAADPRIADYYAGKASLSEAMVGKARPMEHAEISPDWDLTTWLKDVTNLRANCDALRLVLLGGTGTDGMMAAQSLLEALQLDGLALGDVPVWQAQRFGFLTAMVPVWTTEPRDWTCPGGFVPLQLIITDTAPAAINGVTDLILPPPQMTPQLRLSYWHALTGQSDLPQVLHSASAQQLRNWATRLRTDGTLIQDTGLARHDLDEVGEVRTAKVTWDDMVLEPRVISLLQVFSQEAEQRTALLTNAEIHRLFARDAAPRALFSGPPGVGKTMAAECVAGALDLPLLVIDVSRTISKYVGDTSKNLTRIFERAEQFGCLIFFDEADTFFAKRSEGTDSLDRHSNGDTNHLLRLIEQYEGPVILSTNKRGNIDEAFFRRLRHSIDFRRPDTVGRLTLWRRFCDILFSTSDIAHLTLCAERFEFSPAQIKSAVLTARFAAGVTNVDAPAQIDLLGAAARELRKEGKSLPNDLATMIAAQHQGVSHVA
ncbi:ATP-binding protein [Shimia sp. Alg240-R146]|uniref:ATP-binding protein n=1 Tax=Shimia sp. Alg240-R146 TaxID=2993449 RepID=UPI0022E124CF|nr:ATP-binding protein [Shimia sp. Alg240-R146]